MITSFIDGRVRIKDEAFRLPSLASMVRSILISTEGVKEVAVNQRVGSLLIIYDSSKINIRALIHSLRGYITMSEDIETKKMAKVSRVFKQINVRRIANTGMLASLVMTLFAAAIDFTKVHVAAGLLFLGFWSIHLFRYREMIFA